jgi:hypothetical protein
VIVLLEAHRVKRRDRIEGGARSMNGGNLIDDIVSNGYIQAQIVT